MSIGAQSIFYIFQGTYTVSKSFFQLILNQN